MFKIYVNGYEMSNGHRVVLFKEKQEAIDYAERLSMNLIDYDIKVANDQGETIKTFRNGGEVA